MSIPVVKQVNDLLWYLHRRRERHWLRHNVGWWRRVRAEGRPRYVRRIAARWGLTQVVIWSAWHYWADRDFSFGFTVLMIPLSLAFGWFVGASAWADNERLYERAQTGNLHAPGQPAAE